MLYFNLLSSDTEGTDSKYSMFFSKLNSHLRLKLFEKLYSSCQRCTATANVQLLLWLLLLVFS